VPIAAFPAAAAATPTPVQGTELARCHSAGTRSVEWHRNGRAVLAGGLAAGSYADARAVERRERRRGLERPANSCSCRGAGCATLVRALDGFDPARRACHLGGRRGAVYLSHEYALSNDGTTTRAQARRPAANDPADEHDNDLHHDHAYDHELDDVHDELDTPLLPDDSTDDAPDDAPDDLHDDHDYVHDAPPFILPTRYRRAPDAMVPRPATDQTTTTPSPRPRSRGPTPIQVPLPAKVEK